MPPAPPPTMPGRAHAAAAAHPGGAKEEVFVFGGAGRVDAYTGETLHNDLWVIQGAAERGGGAARRVQFGGGSASPPGKPRDGDTSHRPRGSQPTPWFPCRRSHSAMAVTPQGRVYVHGGIAPDGAVLDDLFYADVRYDPGSKAYVAKQWKRVALSGGRRASTTAAAASDSASNDSSDYDEDGTGGGEDDPVGGRGNPPPGLADHAAVYLPARNSLLLIGGVGRGGVRNAMVYSIALDRSTGRAPAATVNPTTVAPAANVPDAEGEAYAEALPALLHHPDGYPSVLGAEAVLVGDDGGERDAAGVLVFGGHSVVSATVPLPPQAHRLPLNEQVYLLDLEGARWVWVAQDGVPTPTPSWTSTVYSPGTRRRDPLIWRYRSAAPGNATLYAGIADVCDTHTVVWRKHRAPVLMEMPAPRAHATVRCAGESLVVSGGRDEEWDRGGPDAAEEPAATPAPPTDVLQDTWWMTLFTDEWHVVDPATKPAILDGCASRKDDGGAAAKAAAAAQVRQKQREAKQHQQQRRRPKSANDSRSGGSNDGAPDAVYHFFDSTGNSRLEIDWEDRVALGQTRALYTPSKPRSPQAEHQFSPKTLGAAGGNGGASRSTSPSQSPGGLVTPSPPRGVGAGGSGGGLTHPHTPHIPHTPVRRDVRSRSTPGSGPAAASAAAAASPQTPQPPRMGTPAQQAGGADSGTRRPKSATTRSEALRHKQQHLQAPRGNSRAASPVSLPPQHPTAATPLPSQQHRRSSSIHGYPHDTPTAVDASSELVMSDCAALRTVSGSPTAGGDSSAVYGLGENGTILLPVEHCADPPESRSSIQVLLKPDPPSTFRDKIRQVLEHDQPSSAVEHRMRERADRQHRSGVVSVVEGHHPFKTQTCLRNVTGGTGHVVSHVNLTTDLETFSTDIMLIDPVKQLKVCVRLNASLSERTKRRLMEQVYNVKETERHLQAGMALLREREARRQEALEEVQRNDARRQREREVEAQEMRNIAEKEAERQRAFEAWEAECEAHRAHMAADVRKTEELEAQRARERAAIEDNERKRVALIQEQEVRLSKVHAREDDLHAGRQALERERAGMQRERELAERDREWELAQMKAGEEERERLEKCIQRLEREVLQRTQAVQDAEAERVQLRRDLEMWRARAVNAQHHLDVLDGREDRESDLEWQRRKERRDRGLRMAREGMFMAASLRLKWTAASQEQITYFILGSAVPRHLALATGISFESGEKPDPTSFVKNAELSIKIVSGLTRLDMLALHGLSEDGGGELSRANGSRLGKLTRVTLPPPPFMGWEHSGPGGGGVRGSVSGGSIRTPLQIPVRAGMRTSSFAGGPARTAPGSPLSRANTGVRAFFPQRRATRTRLGSRAVATQDSGIAAMTVALHGETLNEAAAAAESVLEAVTFATQPSTSAAGPRVVEVVLAINGITLTARRTIEVLEQFIHFPERDMQLTYVEGAGAVPMFPYIAFPGMDEVTAERRDGSSAQLIQTGRTGIAAAHRGGGGGRFGSDSGSRASSPTTTPRHGRGSTTGMPPLAAAMGSMGRLPGQTIANAAHQLAAEKEAALNPPTYLIPMPSAQLTPSGGAFLTIRSMSGWQREDLLVFGDGVETRNKAGVVLNPIGDVLGYVKYGRIGDIHVPITSQNVVPWVGKHAFGDSANVYVGIQIPPGTSWRSVETLARQLCFKNTSSNPSRQKRLVEFQVYFGATPLGGDGGGGGGGSGAPLPPGAGAASSPSPSRRKENTMRGVMRQSSNNALRIDVAAAERSGGGSAASPAESTAAQPILQNYGGPMALQFAQTIEVAVVNYDEPTEIHVTSAELNYAFAYATSPDENVMREVAARTAHRMQVCRRARVIDEDTDIIDEGTMKLYLNTLGDGDRMTFHTPFSPGLELVDGVHEESGEPGQFFAHNQLNVAAVYFDSESEVSIDFIPGMARISTVEAILHCVSFHCEPDGECVTGPRALIIELVIGEMELLCKQISIEVEPPHLLVPSNIRELQFKEGSMPIPVAVLQATRETFPVALLHFCITEGAEATDALTLKGNGTAEAVPWPRGFAGVPSGIVTTEAVAPEIYLLKCEEEHELYLFVASPMPTESVKSVLRRLLYCHGSRNPRNLDKILLVTTTELTKPIIPTTSSAALVIKIMPTDDATELLDMHNVECVMGSEGDRLGCLLAPVGIVHDEDTDFFDAGYLVVESSDDAAVGLAPVEAQHRRYLAATTAKLADARKAGTTTSTGVKEGSPESDPHPPWIVHAEPNGLVYHHPTYEAYMDFRERVPVNAAASMALHQEGRIQATLIGRLGSEPAYRKQRRNVGPQEVPIFTLSFFDGEAMDLTDRIAKDLVQFILRNLVVRSPAKFDVAVKQTFHVHCNAGSAPASNEGYALLTVNFLPAIFSSNGSTQAMLADYAGDQRNALVPAPAVHGGAQVFSFKTFVQKGGTVTIEFEDLDDMDVIHVGPPFQLGGKEGLILHGKVPFAMARRESVTLEKRVILISFEDKAMKYDSKMFLAFLKALSYSYGGEGQASGVAACPQALLAASTGGVAALARGGPRDGAGLSDSTGGDAAAAAPTFKGAKRILLYITKEAGLGVNQVPCLEIVLSGPGALPHAFTVKPAAEHTALGEPTPVLASFAFAKDADVVSLGGCSVEVRSMAPNTIESVVLDPKCDLPLSAIVIPTATRCRIVFAEDADKAAVATVVRGLLYSCSAPGRRAVEVSLTMVSSDGTGTSYTRTVWVTTAPPILNLARCVGVQAPAKTPSKPMEIFPSCSVELPPKKKTLKGATLTIEIGQDADFISRVKRCPHDAPLDTPNHSSLSFARGVTVANGAVTVAGVVIGKCVTSVPNKIGITFEPRKDVATAAAVTTLLRGILFTSNRQTVEAVIRLTLHDKDGGLFGCGMLVTAKAGVNDALAPLQLEWV